MQFSSRFSLLQTDWSFLISQILCGGSTREIYHFMQVANTGRFARYNYGAKMNMKLYNTTEPPLFHLENVNSVTVLYCGKNYIFCTNSDMEKLTSQLSNIASTDFKGKSIFSHNDYLIARDSAQLALWRHGGYARHAGSVQTNVVLDALNLSLLNITNQCTEEDGENINSP
ncbi:hypothetical protein WA026_010182 [Henosepilachna vigintioctopunctata]|uniref:Uncharacterized protein n=1 Tax=Henosepilachna vigintioctopunctata TaxID=420089 RepID=A0AAW1ULK1_9CUCU